MSIFEMLSPSYSEGMRTKWFSFTENVQCLRTRNILLAFDTSKFVLNFLLSGSRSVDLGNAQRHIIKGKTGVNCSVCLSVCLSVLFRKEAKTVL